MNGKTKEDGKIWRGVDANGKTIWTTKEEIEQDKVRLKQWQYENFAKKLGFDPHTTEKEELMKLDAEYEHMIYELKLWHKREERLRKKIEDSL